MIVLNTVVASDNWIMDIRNQLKREPMVPKRQTWTSEENGKDMPIKTKKKVVSQS